MHVPGYNWRPVVGLERDPVLDVVVGTILHVDAGNATSLYNWFNGPSGGIESHAFIPKGPEYLKEQYRDTTHEADANMSGNSWLVGTKRYGFLSVETQGFGSGRWTTYQLESIKDWLLRTSKEHKYPLIPSTGEHGKGVGFHSQYQGWNPNGHACPGAERIAQYHDIIVPWMKEHTSNTYTWKQGDTINKIASKYGLSVLEFWHLNSGAKVPFLKGAKVRIR